MISILISRMMSIFIKLYSDLFIFCPKKPFLIDHFQLFSKTDVKPYRTRKLLYMLNISGSEFRMTDILSDLIAYNTVLSIPVLLLSSVSIPHRYSTVMDRAFGVFSHSCVSSELPLPYNMALVPHQSRNSSISRHFRGFRAATDTLRECENYTAYSEHIHVCKDPVGLLFSEDFLPHSR